MIPAKKETEAMELFKENFFDQALDIMERGRANKLNRDRMRTALKTQLTQEMEASNILFKDIEVKGLVGFKREASQFIAEFIEEAMSDTAKMIENLRVKISARESMAIAS